MTITTLQTTLSGRTYGIVVDLDATDTFASLRLYGVRKNGTRGQHFTGEAIRWYVWTATRAKIEAHIATVKARRQTRRPTEQEVWDMQFEPMRDATGVIVEPVLG